MRKIILLLSLTCLLISCNDFLDVTPKGRAIPENFSHYKGLLYDAQMSKAMDRYPVNLTDDVLYPDTYEQGGQLLEYPFNLSSRTEEVQRLYRFDHGAIFNEGEDDNLWRFSYQRIYACNVVINHIMDVKDASEQDKRTLRAEAMVARAFDYLCLIGAYAPAFAPATAATDLGVPIITKDELSDNTSYKRNTVEEVFKFIVQDLATAEPDLKTTPANPLYPGQSVGYAFFSRMYLMRSEYDKALEYALKSLELNDELVDLKLYTIHPNKNKTIGRIVEAADSITPYPDPQNNPENNYVRFLPRVFGLSGEAYASKELLDLYAKDLPAGAEDMRHTLWFIENEHPAIGEFPGLSLWGQYTQTNAGTSSVENMLTAAEGYARRNTGDDLTKAAELYNRLRDNRIKGNTAVIFADQDDAMKRILDERRREFPFTGMYRYIDLKRLNKEPKYAKEIKHVHGNTTYTLPPNDNRWIIPLPPIVKGFRPDLPDYQR